jgi:hypothetical protein
MSDSDELIAQIKEILKDGRVRHTWQISKNARMIDRLLPYEAEANTMVVEKLKELLDV